MEEVSLSPQGDRLIWLLKFSKKETQEQIWVSSREGKEMKVVARIPKEGIGGLQWNPDGKRVSFEYQEKLWILPVK